MIPDERLRRIRNDLPMAVTIAALGREGPPSKIRDGRFTFLCPHCGEMLAYVNPNNNLAHCFGCAFPHSDRISGRILTELRSDPASIYTAGIR